ncbi:hypothetical protein NQ317_019759 [Molorchus minor]|uniref:Uncharacterized protein n=1 Tax=Molorchus minor TaxID=1323400 RepID=A0ABQ9K392_9CUCU|nr:hypothetical protein NQ317_019759 [Molorchus minor]
MAEYGCKSDILPSSAKDTKPNCSFPTYYRGVQCSLKCCNPTNEDFKPPFYHVLPPGFLPTSSLQLLDLSTL